MEIVANIIETCDKETTETTVEGQSRTHGYLDEPFEGFEENAGRDMLNPGKPQARRGRSAVLMLCLCMTVISVLSEIQRM